MKITLKEHIRRKIIIILSVLLAVSLVLTIWRFSQPLQIEKDAAAYKYTQQAQVNYLVHFQPNAYFNEMTAGPGRGYIMSLTDYIDTRLIYQLNGDSAATVQGNIEVLAKLSGYVLQENETGTKEKIVIWEKTTPLLAPAPYTSNNGKVVIEKTVPIKLSQFKDFVNQVNTAYYNPTDFVDLTIFYNISAIVSNKQGSSISQVCPRLIIPIQGNTFIIAGIPTDKKGNAIKTKRMVQVPGAKSRRGITAGITILLTLLLFLIIYKTKAENEDPAEKELRQIMKKHGDRIAASAVNLPAALNRNVFDMQSFYDLVKVADEAGQPILYDNAAEGVHAFYVINGSLTYYYSLYTSIKKDNSQTATLN